MPYIGRRRQGENQVHVNRFVEVMRGTTNRDAYNIIGEYEIADFDSVNVIPIISSGTADVRVSISWEDPDMEDAPEYFVFDEKEVSAAANPKDNIMHFTQFDTAAGRVRIGIKPTTAGANPTYKVIYKAFFIQGSN